MRSVLPLTAVDYVVVGHIALDVTPKGLRLGGTAMYAALTARALGQRVGIVTAWPENKRLELPDGIFPLILPSAEPTIFENIYTPAGRIQFLRARAADIPLSAIPAPWRSAPIVHLGPIAGEVALPAAEDLAPSLLGLTLQGWLRRWDETGRVEACRWGQDDQTFRQAGAVVLSLEDVAGDEEQIEELASLFPILVVTAGAEGARLYWNGDLRRFPALSMTEVDATGAGDIFAAAFFVRLRVTRDPWEAARFATRLASYSVTRIGLAGIPGPDEIKASLVEVF